MIIVTAEGCGTSKIMHRTGLSKPVVWRWQERYVQEGIDGRLRDKARKPGKPPLKAGEAYPAERALAALAEAAKNALAGDDTRS